MNFCIRITMNSKDSVHGLLYWRNTMGIIELILLAIGLSMDAFAVAVCVGFTMVQANIKKALIVGLYFGLFQAGMPLIGYFAANIFAAGITDYSYWVAFGLLVFLGVKMYIDSIKKKDKTNESYPKDNLDNNKQTVSEQSLKPLKMLPLAIATSIDALAVGVSFVFLQVSIVPAVIFIGVTTLVISMVGVKFGSIFGKRFESNRI
jgi:putative Mn2+ efflux pump MntP